MSLEKPTAHEVRDAFRMVLQPSDDRQLWAARIFLGDMRRRARAHLGGLVVGVDPDPRVDAYYAGSRALFYYMLHRAGMTDEQCDRLTITGSPE